MSAAQTYCIVPDVDVTQAFVDAAQSPESLAARRKSLDGTLSVFSWDGSTPSVFATYDHPPDAQTVGVYTHAEITSVMTGVAWQDP